MLVVETIAKIRRDHLVRGVPIKKIARDLRASKNTVRKVVRGDETSFSYERKTLHEAARPPLLTTGTTSAVPLRGSILHADRGSIFHAD